MKDNHDGEDRIDGSHGEGSGLATERFPVDLVDPCRKRLARDREFLGDTRDDDTTIGDGDPGPLLVDRELGDGERVRMGEEIRSIAFIRQRRPAKDVVQGTRVCGHCEADQDIVDRHRLHGLDGLDQWCARAEDRAPSAR